MICTHCHTDKPLIKDHFRPKKAGKFFDRCRQCDKRATHLSHKIEIFPSADQARILDGCLAAAKFSYNKYLEFVTKAPLINACRRGKVRTQEQLIEAGYPDGVDPDNWVVKRIFLWSPRLSEKTWRKDPASTKKQVLTRQMTVFLREQAQETGAKHWVYQYPSPAHFEPAADVQDAWANYFSGRSEAPRFKGRADTVSVYLQERDLSPSRRETPPSPKHLWLTSKIGWVKGAEKLRFDGKLMSGTISKQASRYFISMQVEMMDYARPRTDNKSVGIDVGLLTDLTVVFAQGEATEYRSPKPLRAAQRRLKQAQQKLSRRERPIRAARQKIVDQLLAEGTSPNIAWQEARYRIPGRNLEKARRKVAAQHKRVADIRDSFQHQATTGIVRQCMEIGIETLNVAGMLQNRRLARSVANTAPAGLLTKIQYKAKLYGTTVTKASRWYPSTQLCSMCGAQNKIELHQRTYHCATCGFTCGRDINAGTNLLPDQIRRWESLQSAFLKGPKAPKATGDTSGKSSLSSNPTFVEDVRCSNRVSAIGSGARKPMLDQSSIEEKPD